MIKKHYNMSAENALLRLSAYCSQAERCESDIRTKLENWGIGPNDSDKIVQRLIDDRFLDETRFVHAYIHDKFTYEHWGRIKIAYQLKSKGLDRQIIAQQMDEGIDPEEYQRVLSDLLRPKVKKMEQPLSPNDRAKLYRFAAGRGFEPQVISLCIKGLGADAEDDDWV